MEEEDKIPTNFQSQGDLEYIARLQAMVTSLNKVIDELIGAQSGEGGGLSDALTEIEDRFADYVPLAGMPADLNAGGHLIKNHGAAVEPHDLVNLQTAQALLATGATPSEIFAPISFSSEGGDDPYIDDTELPEAMGALVAYSNFS